MTVETSHSAIPPFPSDVPTAPIATISLADLLANSQSASEAVLTACQTHGFFYLDLRGTPSGTALLAASEQLRELAERAFALPLEEKARHVRQKGVSLFGYKEAGTVKTTDKDLRPDSTEFFNIAKDHLHGVAPSRSYPAPIVEHTELPKDFTKRAHDTGMLVLRVLALQLGLAPDAFTDLNLFSHPSGDHCRLTKKTPHPSDPTAIGLPSHTDFGSVTLLFTWLGGLQIQRHDASAQWDFVKPLPGHAIINLGDAMVKFTSGALKSAKHRVIPAPGEQAAWDRYSVVYFVRPADDVLMVPLEKFRGRGSVTVAGKFDKLWDEKEMFRAGEWMRQRSIQLGS